MQRVMEVPDVPAFIKGVINLRGKVIPVMDVRLRFGMDAKDYTERTVIIVLDIQDVQIGLAVDAVSDVREISSANIDLPPQYGGNREGRGVIRGLGKQGDRGGNHHRHPPPDFRAGHRSASGHPGVTGRIGVTGRPKFVPFHEGERSPMRFTVVKKIWLIVCSGAARADRDVRRLLHRPARVACRPE